MPGENDLSSIELELERTKQELLATQEQSKSNSNALDDVLSKLNNPWRSPGADLRALLLMGYVAVATAAGVVGYSVGKPSAATDISFDYLGQDDKKCFVAQSPAGITKLEVYQLGINAPISTKLGYEHPFNLQPVETCFNLPKDNAKFRAIATDKAGKTQESDVYVSRQSVIRYFTKE